MTTYEEHLLHRKLRALSERGVLDERQRRLYRKLCLRNTKRFPFSVFQKAVFFQFPLAALPDLLLLPCIIKFIIVNIILVFSCLT